MEFKKLSVQAAPRPTTESAYWTRLSSQVFISELGSIQHVSFQTTPGNQTLSPQLLAVCSSTRVQIYRNAAVKKTISRFKDVALHARIRNESVLAGDSTGLVQLFDLNSRSVLRTFRGHNGAVNPV